MADLQALVDTARVHWNAGRWSEAASAYRALLAQRPDLADTWFNLGLMERRAGRPTEALAAYDQALALGIAGPQEVWLNRAVIQSDDLGDSDGALASLIEALRLAPSDLAVLLNLGNLREDRGERTAAQAAYRQALETAPGHPVALARLANATVFDDADDPLIERLRTALATARDAADRAELAFALGRALDAAGAYPDAFEAYGAANAASRNASGVVYDPAAVEDHVTRTLAAHARPVDPDLGDAADAPVFILGMFRSGSTLLERMLAAHPAVTSGGELNLLPRLAAGIGDDPRTVADADAATRTQWRDRYMAGLRALRPPGGLITDKRPDNFLHIGLIKAMFPRARILHTVRDPRDVCLSNWFLHLDPRLAHATDLTACAHWLGRQNRLTEHFKGLYPDDILPVDYDALVADPRPELERVLAFLGLDWDDACLRFHEQPGAVRTASVWQVREPLYRRSSGRWRHYADRLGALDAALAVDA